MEKTDEDKSNSAVGDTPKVQKLTSKEFVIIVLLCFGSVLVAACSSLQGPFYPQTAEEKGTSSTVYGLIQGSFMLTIFAVAPAVGKLQEKGNIKYVLISGAVITGICSIGFGLLIYVMDTLTFIALSFTIRISEGIGGALFRVAYNTIGVSLFPARATTIFALFRTFSGVGLIIGPLIGGALFDYGGFKLPFIVIGCAFLLEALIAVYILPNTENPGKKRDTSCRFWFNIGTMVYYVDSVVTLCIYSSFIVTLDHHIRSFEMSGFQTGLVFSAQGIMHLVGAPFWGWLLDKWKFSRFLLSAGSVIIILSQILIGPMPFLQLEKQLWLVYVSRVILGIGTGLKFVSLFNALVQDSIDRGYEKGVVLFGLISSAVSSSQSLGMFLGPTVSGYVFDKEGFDVSVLVWTYAQIATLAILLLYFIATKSCMKPNRTGKVDVTSTKL